MAFAVCFCFLTIKSQSSIVYITKVNNYSLFIESLDSGYALAVKLKVGGSGGGGHRAEIAYEVVKSVSGENNEISASTTVAGGYFDSCFDNSPLLLYLYCNYFYRVSIV